MASFFERNRAELEAKGIDPNRLPPGQYHTDRFPVLHAGVVPAIDTATWDFTVGGLVEHAQRWTFDEFRALETQRIVADIHCVTKWSKLDTRWKGVSVDTLLDGVETEADWVTAFADGDYTTNLGLEDVTEGRAWIAYEYDGAPLDPEHGGPARLLVPHLYFWKSAKWVRGLELRDDDEPGFWEAYGYHNYGDPWKEQRYWGD